MNRRLVLVGYSVVGLMALAIGCAIVLYVYAFASMVDPRLTPGEFRREVLIRMFLSWSVVPTVFGLTLALAGTVTVTWAGAAAVGVIPDRHPGWSSWRGLAVALVTLIALIAIIMALG